MPTIPYCSHLPALLPLLKVFLANTVTVCSSFPHPPSHMAQPLKLTLGSLNHELKITFITHGSLKLQASTVCRLQAKY